MIFTIVTDETLNSVLPDSVISMMEYLGNPTLKDKVLVCNELEDGNFAVSVNLKAVGKQCAWSDLSPSEIEMAKIMYGEDNLLTQEEYKKLDFKEVFDE